MNQLGIQEQNTLRVMRSASAFGLRDKNCRLNPNFIKMKYNTASLQQQLEKTSSLVSKANSRNVTRPSTAVRTKTYSSSHVKLKTANVQNYYSENHLKTETTQQKEDNNQFTFQNICFSNSKNQLQENNLKQYFSYNDQIQTEQQHQQFPLYQNQRHQQNAKIENDNKLLASTSLLQQLHETILDLTITDYQSIDKTPASRNRPVQSQGLSQFSKYHSRQASTGNLRPLSRDDSAISVQLNQNETQFVSSKQNNNHNQVYQNSNIYHQYNNILDNNSSVVYSQQPDYIIEKKEQIKDKFSNIKKGIKNYWQQFKSNNIKVILSEEFKDEAQNLFKFLQKLAKDIQSINREFYELQEKYEEIKLELETERDQLQLNIKDANIKYIEDKKKDQKSIKFQKEKIQYLQKEIGLFVSQSPVFKQDETVHLGCYWDNQLQSEDLDVQCVLLDQFGGIEEIINQHNRFSIAKSIYSAYLEDKIYKKEILIKLDKISPDIKAVVILISNETENYQNLKVPGMIHFIQNNKIQYYQQFGQRTGKYFYAGVLSRDTKSTWKFQSSGKYISINNFYSTVLDSLLKFGFKISFNIIKALQWDQSNPQKPIILKYNEIVPLPKAGYKKIEIIANWEKQFNDKLILIPCLILMNKEGRVVDHANPIKRTCKLHSVSMYSTGEAPNLTHHCHRIFIDPNNIRQGVKSIWFCINIKSPLHDFNDISDGYIIVNICNQAFLKYDLTKIKQEIAGGGKNKSGCFLFELARQGNKWVFLGKGLLTEATNSSNQMFPIIEQHLEDKSLDPFKIIHFEK